MHTCKTHIYNQVAGGFVYDMANAQGSGGPVTSNGNGTATLTETLAFTISNSNRYQCDFR